VRLQKVLTQPINVYFVTFLVTGVFILLFLIWSLYSQSQNIQQTVIEKSFSQAQEEFTNNFNASINHLTLELKTLSEWDEVHQQLQDPSYYFFWHNERLKESVLFKKNYEQIELYNADKKRLIPIQTDASQTLVELPPEIQTLEPKVIILSATEAHLILFQTVLDREDQQIIGYIGASIDLLSFLIQNNDFTYVNKSTIQFSKLGEVSLKTALSYIHYEPVANQQQIIYGA